MKSEFLVVAKQLMEIERRAMKPEELVDLAVERKLFSDNIAGKTPHHTMKSKLSVHVRSKGERSIFIRTSPGYFYLRSLVEDPSTIFEAKPLSPPVSTERVLVFPSEWLDSWDRFQGIKTSWRRLAHHLFKSKVCKYMDRREAELDDSQKQILTYIMVTRGNEVLAYKRGSYTRAEEFLRGSHCVGFGGHVAALDYNLFHGNDYGIRQSAIRELFEEIQIPVPDYSSLGRGDGLEIVGLLNDDSSSTGRKHMAFLFRYEISGDPSWDRPKRNEKSITQLRWIDPMKSPQSLWQFEYWSQLCLLQFYQKTKITKPTFKIRRKRPLRPPNLLIVLGPVGSGKSETTRILVKNLNYNEINSGKIVAEHLGLPPVSEESRKSFQNASFEFINSDKGPAMLARSIWNRVREHQNDRILIEGIRQRKTLIELKKLAGQLSVGILYVHTPPDIAYKFYKHRVDKQLKIHEFLQIRENPVESEVEGMINLADAVLYNYSGRIKYRKEIQKMMLEIGVK